MKKSKILSVISMEANTGKTTFIEGIIPELSRRGYKIMTLKYSCHDFDIDQEGTDSYKHFNSGAHRTVLVGPNKCAVIEKTDQHKNLYEIAEKYDDVDLIVTEGFRKLDEMTIEIIRECKTRKLTTPLKNLLAVVSDTNDLKTIAPIYDLNDYSGICDLIEKKMLNKNLLNIIG
jgi:molybdopterin-guanine dinucleotide biosynthesis protein MobB